MAEITLEVAQQNLDTAIAAQLAVLDGGQEIRLTTPNGIDRTVTQADMRDIQRAINFWQGVVNRLKAQAADVPTLGGMTFSSANFGN